MNLVYHLKALLIIALLFISFVGITQDKKWEKLLNTDETDTSFYPNGLIKSLTSKRNCRYITIAFEYYITNTLKSKTLLISSGYGRPDKAHYLRFYENGNIKIDSTYESTSRLRIKTVSNHYFTNGRKKRKLKAISKRKKCIGFGETFGWTSIVRTAIKEYDLSGRLVLKEKLKN